MAGFPSDIRVLDVGSFVAGPAAATVMSDFGAEVITYEVLRELDRVNETIEGMIARGVVKA